MTSPTVDPNRWPRYVYVSRGPHVPMRRSASCLSKYGAIEHAAATAAVNRPDAQWTRYEVDGVTVIAGPIEWVLVQFRRDRFGYPE